MKYHVILFGTGGELDRRTVATEAELNEALADLIKDLEVAVGDTIRVVEGEE